MTEGEERDHGCIYDEPTLSHRINRALRDPLDHDDLAVRSCEIDIMREAAHGNLSKMKYLVNVMKHLSPKKMNKDTARIAAENGHLDCLMYAHDNGCELPRPGRIKPTTLGQLKCIKYLHENGRVWDASLCSWLGATGQDKLLAYAHENGCPWNKSLLCHSVRTRNAKCVKYYLAHENESHLLQIRKSKYGAKLCETAATNNDLDSLKILHENRFNLNDTLNLAASCGYMNCVKYALENGCVPSSSVCAQMDKFVTFNELWNRSITIRSSLVYDEACLVYIKSMSLKTKAAVKIQSAMRGIIVRKTNGVYNPHSVIGKHFLSNMFNIYITDPQ
jgi:hypothetical protein